MQVSILFWDLYRPTSCKVSRTNPRVREITLKVRSETTSGTGSLEYETFQKRSGTSSASKQSPQENKVSSSVTQIDASVASSLAVATSPLKVPPFTGTACGFSVVDVRAELKAKGNKLKWQIADLRTTSPTRTAFVVGLPSLRPFHLNICKSRLHPGALGGVSENQAQSHVAAGRGSAWRGGLRRILREILPRPTAIFPFSTGKDAEWHADMAQRQAQT